MTYRYFQDGDEMIAINSENGYIKIDSDSTYHSITTGVSGLMYDHALRFAKEITKEEFFDYITYPLAVIDNAVKFFQKGDPDYIATSKAATERRAVYNEQKSEPYH